MLDVFRGFLEEVSTFIIFVDDKLKEGFSSFVNKNKVDG